MRPAKEQRLAQVIDLDAGEAHGELGPSASNEKADEETDEETEERGWAYVIAGYQLPLFVAPSGDT